ncbi:DNA polymerase [Scheffersomyces coipomensis]|uniref:DNA polymerase n=1 Tax=Scheffersomyces coipomensis TaxID=1788519 RepID=UPI00315C50B9
MAVSKDHYYRLASEVPKERIEAATSLLSDLIEANSKEDWEYALNRLLKGLITSRQSARFGFSMALTEVLLELINKNSEGYEEITIDYYLDLLLKTTQLASSMKGKEERSVLFGRLFGLQVLINTKLLFNAEACKDESLFKFINCIIELSNLKSWLRETTIFTLHQFIRAFLSPASDHSKDLKDKVIIAILQVTNDQGLNLSSEGVAIYLSIPKENRSKLASHIVNEKANWKNGDPFTKGNLPLLAKALKDVEVADPEAGENKQKGNKNPKQKGSWSPRIPFVWDLIIQEFNTSNESEEVSNENSKKRKKSSNNDSKKKKHSSSSSSEPTDVTVQEFWKVVIDDSFYAEKSSHERKFWGFEIFIKFLKELTSIESIQYLFTSNFMRCLVNQTSQANRMLHKISTKALKVITEEAQSNPEKVPIIFNRLIDETNGGSWNFDLITKSKTVDSLLTVKGDDKIIADLKNILIQSFNTALDTQEDIDNQNTNKKSNDNKIKWSLDKLLLLIRRNLTIINAKDIEDITKLLIRQTFFHSSDQPQVSENVKSACQERLNSILADIINLKRSDNISWAYYCLKYIFKLEESSKFKNLIDFDEELLVIKQETSVILKSISELMTITKSESKKDQLHCFELLYSMVLIQMYMGDDEAVQVIGELNLCYENTFSDETDDGVDTSVVLTEIILSFISRKSNLLKKLAFTVWEFFVCGNDQSGKIRLNEASLQLLYDVLYSKENKEGQQKLFEGEDEMVADDDEDEEKDNEKDEDEEDKDDEDEDEDNSDSDDEESEESEEEDEEEVATDKDKLSEIDKETNLKLAKALGIPTAESGEVKFEDLDSSDDEEYESDSMDDEQMMAMDDQLSKIFKERQDILSNISTGNKRKAEVMEAKEHMIFFKNRILDLLEIFNRVQPNSLLNLTAIKPIITMINLTLNKELGVKAHKLLKTKINRTKITDEDVQKYYPSKKELKDYKESLLTLIIDLQTELNSKKSTSQGHSLACNQACIIISKNLVAIDTSYLENIIEIYSSSLKNWALNPKSNIQPSLFFDFINWLNSKR